MGATPALPLFTGSLFPTHPSMDGPIASGEVVGSALSQGIEIEDFARRALISEGNTLSPSRNSKLEYSLQRERRAPRAKQWIHRCILILYWFVLLLFWPYYTFLFILLYFIIV